MEYGDAMGTREDFKGEVSMCRIEEGGGGKLAQHPINMERKRGFTGQRFVLTTKGCLVGGGYAIGHTLEKGAIRGEYCSNRR